MAVAIELRPEAPIFIEEEDKDIKVRMHLANFLPWAALASNRRIAKWAKEAGYDDGVEWIALQARIFPLLFLGPTREVLTTPLSKLGKVIEGVKSAHVTFYPYPTTALGIMRGTPDRLGFNNNLPAVLLALASSQDSFAAIKKLEEVNPNLSVTTYPPFRGKNLYGEYKKPYYQTSPHFDQKMGLDEMIDLVKRTEQLKKSRGETWQGGVTVDLFHMRQTRDGSYPFIPWQEALEKFWKAGVLKEAHVQPCGGGQPDFGIRPESKGEFRTFVEGGNEITELDRMVVFLKDLGFRGPYVTEFNPLSLKELKGPQALRIANMIESHQLIVDRIKNI